MRGMPRRPGATDTTFSSACTLPGALLREITSLILIVGLPYPGADLLQGRLLIARAGGREIDAQVSRLTLGSPVATGELECRRRLMTHLEDEAGLLAQMRVIPIFASRLVALREHAGPARPLGRVHSGAGDRKAQQQIVLLLIGPQESNHLAVSVLEQQEIGVSGLRVAIGRVCVQRGAQVRLGRDLVTEPERHIGEQVKNPHANARVDPRIVAKIAAQDSVAWAESASQTVDAAQTGHGDQLVAESCERPASPARLDEAALHLQKGCLGEPGLRIRRLETQRAIEQSQGLIEPMKILQCARRETEHGWIGTGG